MRLGVAFLVMLQLRVCVCQVSTSQRIVPQLEHTTNYSNSLLAVCGRLEHLPDELVDAVCGRLELVLTLLHLVLQLSHLRLSRRHLVLQLRVLRKTAAVTRDVRFYVKRCNYMTVHLQAKCVETNRYMHMKTLTGGVTSFNLSVIW